MARRIIVAILVFLLSSVTAEASGRRAYKSSGYLASVGLSSGITFHAPFNDNSSPLKINIGSGSFTYLDPVDNVLTIDSPNGADLRTAGGTLYEPIANINWAVGSMIATVSRYTLASNTVFRPVPGASSTYFIFEFISATTLDFYYGILANHVSVSSTDNNFHTVGITWTQNGQYCVCIDGGTPACGTHSGALYSTGSSSSQLGTQATEDLRGYLRDHFIWGRALSNDELKAATKR